MSLKFKLAWGASIVIISWCCGAPMMFLFFNLMGREYVVSSIAAPDYPGSRLQSRETGGGAGGTWIKRIYHTPDSQNKVLAFMESRMPGYDLRELADPLRTAPIYSNSTCAYETLPGRYFYRRGDYPCISSSIYPDAKTQSETLIEVFEWYPDPF